MKKIAFIIIAIATLFVPFTPILAKDNTATIPTVAGPCSDQFSFSDTGLWTSYYPLPHELGTVGVNMDSSTGVPRLVSACINPGWTVRGGNVFDGIQLEFSYLGRSAIDFKYVLGKTVIRFK